MVHRNKTLEKGRQEVWSPVQMTLATSIDLDYTIEKILPASIYTPEQRDARWPKAGEIQGFQW